MNMQEAGDTYSRWRKRATPSMRGQFDNLFEAQEWLNSPDGWGKVSRCGKFIMVVTEKSIRLISDFK